mgnify:FL=1
MYARDSPDTLPQKFLEQEKPYKKFEQFAEEATTPKTSGGDRGEVDHLPKVLYLAIAFLLIFSAYNPVQNTVSVLFGQLGEDYLGIFAMVVVNQTYGIASLIVPIVGPKLPPRIVFACSSCCFVAFIYIGKLISSCAAESTSLICQSYFIYTMMMAASILTGFGLGFIWFTGSIYIQACCNENNKGRMFGIFGAIQQSSNLTGAVLALVLLKWFGVSGFFFCQALIGLLAAVLFTRVKNPSEFSQQEKVANQDPVTLRKLMHFMARPKMKGFYPLIMLSSYSFGFLVSNLSKMSANTVSHLPQDEANVKVSYVLVFFGVSELIASLVCGTIFDKSKELAVKIMIGFAFLASILDCLGYNFSWYMMFFPIGFCFGFLDSGMQVLLGALLSSRFTEKYEQFAIFRFVQGLYQAFFFLVCLFLEKISPQLMFVVHFAMAVYAWRAKKGY